MRIFIIGFDVDTKAEMEKYYLVSAPPVKLMKELFSKDAGVFDSNTFVMMRFPVKVKELVMLEPHLLHKTDHYRLGRLEYFLGFEPSYDDEVINEFGFQL